MRSPRTGAERSGRVLRRVAGAVTVAVLAALSGLALAGPAGAHTGNQSYLYLDVTETSLGGRVEAPLGDLNAVLGLDLGGADGEIEAGLAANAEEIDAYLADHLEIGEVGGGSWPITFEGGELFFSDLPEADDNYVIFPFTVEVAGDEVPRQLDVRFDPFFDEIDGRDALLLIGNDWQAGVIENGWDVFTAFDAGSRSQAVDLGQGSWVKTVVASGQLGIDHIRTGPDHILFVLVLLLPSVLVFSTRWEPTRSFRASLWRVLKIVTMFTVAHSITFTLAGLDILPLPSSRFVESVIAVSIAVAALHNLRPLAANKEWLISFLFGLFHGMGFASLVSGLDVGRGTQLISLLGRNAGIEVGQALVVLLLFPGLYLLRRTRYFRGFFLAVSVLMATISLGWMIERLFVVDLGVSAWVDPVIAWPRVLIYVAAFTVAAAGLNHLERSNQRLLPVLGDGEGGAEPAAGQVPSAA